MALGLVGRLRCLFCIAICCSLGAVIFGAVCPVVPVRTPCAGLSVSKGDDGSILLCVLSGPLTGVDCELSARDFREDDRGVMFEVTKFVTGVALSSNFGFVEGREGVV